MRRSVDWWLKRVCGWPGILFLTQKRNNGVCSRLTGEITGRCRTLSRAPCRCKSKAQHTARKVTADVQTGKAAETWRLYGRRHKGSRQKAVYVGASRIAGPYGVLCEMEFESQNVQNHAAKPKHFFNCPMNLVVDSTERLLYEMGDGCQV